MRIADRPQRSSGLGVPQPDNAIVASGSDPRSIGMKLHGADCAPMPQSPVAEDCHEFGRRLRGIAAAGFGQFLDRNLFATQFVGRLGIVRLQPHDL